MTRGRHPPRVSVHGHAAPRLRRTTERELTTQSRRAAVWRARIQRRGPCGTLGLAGPPTIPPEPADMHADDGVFDGGDRNSSSAIGAADRKTVSPIACYVDGNDPAYLCANTHQHASTERTVIGKVGRQAYDEARAGRPRVTSGRRAPGQLRPGGDGFMPYTGTPLLHYSSSGKRNCRSG